MEYREPRKQDEIGAIEGKSERFGDCREKPQDDSPERPHP